MAYRKRETENNKRQDLVDEIRKNRWQVIIAVLGLITAIITCIANLPDFPEQFLRVLVFFGIDSAEELIGDVITVSPTALVNPDTRIFETPLLQSTVYEPLETDPRIILTPTFEPSLTSTITSTPSLLITELVQTIQAEADKTAQISTLFAGATAIFETATASAQRTDTPVSIVNPSTVEVSPTFGSRYMYGVIIGKIRACAYLTCNQIGSVAVSQEFEVLEDVEGDYFARSSGWYRVFYDGRDGYIHESVLSETPSSIGFVTQRPDVPLPIPNTTQLTPSVTSCTGGGIAGSAADLFGYAGVRTVSVSLRAGQIITATLSVSDGAGDWGVDVSLISASGETVGTAGLYDETNSSANSFSYTAESAGDYSIQLRGDSRHTYSYSVSWSCS